jgi:hypothetical protein
VSEQVPEPVPEQVVEQFKPTSGRITGVLGLLLAGAVIVIGLLDREQFPILLVAIAVLAAALIWSSMLRPRLWVTSDHVVLRNMVTTTRIPLAAVERVAVRQVVSIHAGDRRYVSPAVGRSLRHALPTQKAKEQTALSSYPVFVEERLHHLVDEARTRSGVKPYSDEQLELAGQVDRTWAWPEIAALTLGGLAVLVAVVAAL